MTQVPVGAHHLHVSARVDARLSSFFDERIRVAARYGDAYRQLWARAKMAAERGKRLRPRFVLSAFSAFGGDTGERSDRLQGAIDVAVAFEVLHTAFLLHDDVIDGDTVRRGMPNLAGGFEADARAGG
ncbi:MAG: polyprenyl synthetase family protein, partial [Leifsonia sp.]